MVLNTYQTKEAIANREAIIRGILHNYWGELGDRYDEDYHCEDVYCVVTDDPNYSHYPSVKDIADKIAEYSK